MEQDVKPGDVVSLRTYPDLEMTVIAVGEHGDVEVSIDGRTTLTVWSGCALVTWLDPTLELQHAMLPLVALDKRGSAMRLVGRTSLAKK